VFQKNFIVRGDSFDFAFADYFSEERDFIRKNFNAKVKRIDKKDFSYRIINHWEENGLLDADRGDGQGWRKFSLIDIVWLNIIVELRKFGVSIENIHKVKQRLNFLYKEGDISSFHYLEFYTAQYLLTKQPTFLLVFNNFEVEIAVDSEIRISDELNTLDNFIRVNLHTIIQGILPSKDLTPIYNDKIGLNDDELSLMLAIRTGAYKELVIKMKNGKINRIDKKVENPEKKIHQLLKQKTYDTITIIRENGKIIDVQQTVKEKL
jgi:DNA-binding transcriptional MerR regulator